MANEGERLTKLEVRVDTHEDALHGDDGLSRRLREVEKTVWKAFGAMASLQVVIVILMEAWKTK